MSNRPTAPTYLIVCFRFIGDVLVTTPLALSIKTAHPDAIVDYLVFKGTEKILEKNPHIRNVITIPRNTSGIGILLSLFRKYDVAIAAYPSDRTAIAAAIAGKYSIGLTYGRNKEWWKHLVLSSHQICNGQIHVVSNILNLLCLLGIEPIQKVVMGFDESDAAYARKAILFDRYIVLHPYSMKAYKYWPAEKWANLANLIQEQTDCTPVFTRTPEPEGDEYLEQIRKLSSKRIEVLNSACTLNQLAAIIKSSVAYVGIDTVITHMAAALKIPTVAIFGPTLTRYWAPWPNGSQNPSPFAEGKSVQRKDYVTIVQKNWQCIPCNKEICRISNRGVMECLEELSAAEVFVGLENLIKKSGISNEPQIKS